MRWSAALVFFLALAFNVQGAPTAKSAECLSCHDDKGASFHSSVHGSLSCTDCHSDKNAYPHAANAAKVKCDTCHAEPAAGVTASVHAGVSKQACEGCHGEVHAILPSKDPKSKTYAANLPRTCGVCHGDAKLDQQHGIKEVYSQYMDSIHGFALTKDGLLVAANCSSCHGTHKILSKKDPASRTNRANVAATCGTCHAGPKEDYNAGIHGQLAAMGDERAPGCTDCHTTHQIASVRTAAWQMKTTATCGGCHKDESETYRDTFHAQVSALGYVETAHCWDCHGFHDIRPSTDPKSTIARANLQATCGKCHKDVTMSFVSYQPHADRHKLRAYPAMWGTWMFMNMALLSVIGGFGLHTVLWLIRALAERREKLGPAQ